MKYHSTFLALSQIHPLFSRDFRKAYTSTLRSVARFLCPMALYQKLILRKKAQNRLGVKQVSSATGISEFNANLYSSNGLGRNNENGKRRGGWKLSNATSSICDSSKGLICNLDLLSKMLCCCACCSASNETSTVTADTSKCHLNGNHKPQSAAENGRLASSQHTSSHKNERPSTKPLTSIRKLFVLSQKKEPTPSPKESTTYEAHEETVKFLGDLDDRFKRFDKQGNLISCRI